MKPKLGFVGLGNIGEPICRRLLDNGYEVSIHDVDPKAVSKLGDTQAQPAESLEALAASADVVLLSLPNSDVVEQVVLEGGGLVDGLSSGKVLIDTSSSRPASTRMVAERLAGSGVDMLDAPVSGGVLRARTGELSVMVGGEREVFERCQEVLRAFGSQVFHVGDHGAGHLVKSLNNLLSATTLASAAEAIILARKAGIAPETFLEVINAGNARSYSTEVKFPQFILDRSFDDGFALDLMAKDLKIALETAAEIGHPMFSGSTIAQLWQAAAAQGYGSTGHTSIHAFLERLTGEEQ
ncbi:MAG: NAD(P)-dependent oxidoreductase [Rubrobacter sp.]|nr:NAD(P)-dependent oxidoreductase [Rubrobacter sp.]